VCNLAIAAIALEAGLIMKALILNSLENDINNDAIIEMVAAEVNNHTIDIERIDLLEEDFEACRFCYHCWTKTPGICVIEDAAKGIIARMYQSDWVIAFTTIDEEQIDNTPVNIQVADMLKRMFERSIPIPKYSNLFVIGICEQASPIVETAFKETIERIGINFRYQNVASVVLANNWDKAERQSKLQDIITRIL